MFKRFLFEGLLLLVIIGFFLVQRLDVVFMAVIVAAYLVIVFLNDNFLSRIKKGMGDVKKNRQYGILFLMIIALMFIWQFSLESIIFITLFIAFTLYRWDSRIVTSGALISLASSLFLLIVKRDALAEQMTVYAFYFLAMAVALVIIEYKRSPEKSSDEGPIEQKIKRLIIVDSIIKYQKNEI